MRATTRRPSFTGGAGRTLLVLPALLLAAVAAAAPPPRAAQVRFSATTELPAAGLKFRIPADLAETPIPSPAVELYQVTDRDGTRAVECLAPAELWRNGQVEGMWSDAKGVAFIVATVKTEPPATRTPHLPREAAAAVVARAVAPTNWGTDRLTQWVASFAAHPVATISQIQRPPSAIREAWLVTLGGGEACGILFRPYITVALRKTESPHFLFAWVRVPRNGDAEAVAAALRDEFLPSVTTAKPSADPSPAADTRFQNRRAWDKETASAEQEASRKRVAESIRNLRDWWYADTPHYVVLSDLPSRHRQVVKELQTRTERYRELFEAAFPPRKPVNAVSVIRVFATDEAYEAFVGQDYKWTTGMWVPHRRELVARPIRVEFQRDEQERFLQVVAHEAFHQYVSATMEPALPAPWFNEGHAELFARSALDRDRLVVTESPSYTPILEALAKAGKLDAGRVMTLSYEQFYAGEKEVLAAHYAIAWGLVYYLHKSAGADAKSPFREVIPKYRKELTAVQNGTPPAIRVVSTLDMQALNRDFTAFWTSHSRRQAVKKNPLLVCQP